MRGAVAFGALALVLAAVFVRLGVWQLARAEERRIENDRVGAALRLPSLELDALQLHDSLAFRRAMAAGRYDFSRERVVSGRTWKGSPGVELLTPLVLENGRDVWVNRGWVPSADARTVNRAAYGEPSPVRVRGFLRRARQGERTDHGSAVVLEQLPDPALPAYPIRRGEPELSAGPHLSYAIQWFGFAVIAVVGTGVFLYSRRLPQRGRRPPAPPDASASSDTPSVRSDGRRRQAIAS